jgi:hypothetical protein
MYFYKFASKTILFQEALQFRVVIVLCYNQQTRVRVTSHVPPPLTWHIYQIIVDVLFLIITAYVLNHFCGRWLFSDALNVTITKSLKP